MFVVAAWAIWRWRNEYIFKDEYQENEKKMQWIEKQSEDIKEAFRKAEIIQRSGGQKHNIILTWNKPVDGAHAINVDGCVKWRNSSAGCAGVIRDKDGKWEGGYLCKLKTNNVAMAEGWAILKALEWAWSRGYMKIIIQSDSPEVIEGLQRYNEVKGPLRTVIDA